MTKIYKVTTQGDCEGRTVRDLGIWQGDVGEIALHLAEHQAYHLRFTEIEIGTPGQPTRSEVDVHGDKSLTEEIKHSPYLYEHHNGQWGLTAKFRLNPAESKEMERQAVLDKLTPHERELLNL